MGKSMVIIGAAMNHWYHSDMNYRGVINMLVLCGCVGKRAAAAGRTYVGQEKLRPQTGWTALAFALDWLRPPRQQNSTSSFFYAHRPVALRDAGMDEDAVALADKTQYAGSMIDFNAAPSAWAGCQRAAAARPIRCRWCRRRGGRHGREGLRGQVAEGRVAR